MPFLHNKFTVDDSDNQIQMMRCQRSVDHCNIARKNPVGYEVRTCNSKIERGRRVYNQQILQVQRLIDVVVVRAGEASWKRRRAFVRGHDETYRGGLELSGNPAYTVCTYSIWVGAGHVECNYGSRHSKAARDCWAVARWRTAGGTGLHAHRVFNADLNGENREKIQTNRQ